MIKKINYTGSSKIIQRICEAINALIDQGGGGGGSNVTITPSLSSGTKIADYSIDDAPGVLYAPTPPEVHNVPAGGSSGQMLVKSSPTNYDMEWANQPVIPEVHNLPARGSTNQMLVKNSNDDYDAKWVNPPEVHNVPAGGTTNQVLAKSSGVDYDLKWVTQSGGGGMSPIYYDQDGYICIDYDLIEVRENAN